MFARTLLPNIRQGRTLEAGPPALEWHSTQLTTSVCPAAYVRANTAASAHRLET
jgi:hypothetical protein